MAQQQKSKLGVGTIIVVCLVAAAGVAVMKGMNQPRTIPKVNTRDELVTFVVTFEPTLRTKVVSMVVVAGPKPIAPFVDIRSPIVNERMVPPGTPVQLIAEQPEDGTLTCKIRKGFKVIAEQKRDSKGTLVCEGVTLR